jgi:hypothetical protein
MHSQQDYSIAATWAAEINLKRLERLERLERLQGAPKKFNLKKTLPALFRFFLEVFRS